MVTTISACSPIALLNVSSSSSHYDKTENVAYGDGPRQQLDVYKPNTTVDAAPMVIFFYGGGWRDGDKADYEFVASALTEAGIVVVVPDYRLFPDITFPAFVEDGAMAVNWALDNAERLGVDRSQVFAMGHSAGAHIAALLVLDKRYLSSQNFGGQPFAGLIGLSGPYDFLPLQNGYLQDVFPQALRDASQPINFVTTDAPTTLLIHGTDDTTVLPKNSHNLAEKLQAQGVQTTLKFYDDVGHARVVAALAPKLQFLASTMNDTKEFILRESGEAAHMDKMALESGN
ncbi:MAG: alpha/beta hydrolase [Woeseia sp.]|nr:alpha/beta hydrolase [Woeseia sp.]NNE59920.1 alpha/beta hydrolase [Woeseia sp.]NNL53964.1 alpha/beta hydrolase [Woeseia sp.]